MNFKETVDDINNINENIYDSLSLGDICIEDELYTAKTILSIVNDLSSLIDLNTDNINNLSSSLNNKIDIIYNDLSDDISNYHNLKNELFAIYCDLLDDISNYNNLSSELKNDISKLSTNLSNSISELKTEVSTLSTNLSNNISTLSSSLSLEVSNLSSELKTEVSALSTNLSNSISTLSSSLSVEIFSLSGELKDDISRLTNKHNEDISRLNDELKVDISNLSTNLSTEISNLSNEVSTLDNYINSIVDNTNSNIVILPSISVDSSHNIISKDEISAFKLSVFFDPGHYKYGPEDTKISVSGVSTIPSCDITTENNISVLLFNADVLTTSTNIEISVNYTEGDIPNTITGMSAENYKISASTLSSKVAIQILEKAYISCTEATTPHSVKEFSTYIYNYDFSVPLETNKMESILIKIPSTKSNLNIAVKNAFNGFPQNITVSNDDNYKYYQVKNKNPDTSKYIYDIEFLHNNEDNDNE